MLCPGHGTGETLGWERDSAGGWHGGWRPPWGGFAEQTAGRRVTALRAARRGAGGKNRGTGTPVPPGCAWGAASRPGEPPWHGWGSAGARPCAAEARAAFGAGRAAALPRQVTLSPRAARPPGRDAAEAPAPEIYFNVNLALRQLFLIFKLFHINPWPDICFL